MKNCNDGNGATLLAQIEKHRLLLTDCMAEIAAAEAQDVPLLGRSKRAGVLIAGLIENYYTCLETIFLRISQYFENDLAADRWHRDVLDRMTLEIESLRPRVISEAVFEDLLELMRFRHFKRYYFGTAYDWERLDALLIRLRRLHEPLLTQIEAFTRFLRETTQSPPDKVLPP